MLMKLTTTRRRPAQPALAPPSALVAWDREPERCALLRLWEIDPDALFIVLAMLLDRGEIESLFAEIERDDRSAIRARRWRRVRCAGDVCGFGMLHGRVYARARRSRAHPRLDAHGRAA
jgi:hypothetical protein